MFKIFRKTVFVSVMLALSGVGAIAGEKIYNIDNSHSNIGFSVRHMVVSKTRGNFTDYEGKLNWNVQKPEQSQVEFTIKSVSINTQNEKRDNHLRSADFFEVEKYPTLTFKSTSIKKRGKKWIAAGDFTLHGVTKKIEIPFKFAGPVKGPYGFFRLGIEGEITIDRFDYGLQWNHAIETGELVVGREVTIHLETEWISKAE